MPRVIAQNRIPRVSIANRSIALQGAVAAPPTALGSGIGAGVWAAAAPGPNWVTADALTEAAIASMRLTGALPAVPQVARQRTPATFPWTTQGQNGNYAYSNNRKFYAAGGGYFGISPSGANAGSSAALTLLPAHWNTNQLTQLLNQYPATGGAGALAPSGYSFANGEFHHMAPDGLYSAPFPVLGGNPTCTKRGTTSPGGNAFYSQLVWIAGNYVIFSIDLASIAPRYTTDRVNYTNCTIPALANVTPGVGDWIPCIVPDLPRNRLVAVTQYGEILTSPDGITWTKTFTRASGGANQSIVRVWVSPSGKVFATGSGLAAGQYYVAPDVTSAFAVQTVVLGGGKTLLTRAFDVNGTAGVVGLLFQATTATPTSTSIALSVDDGATWLFGTGGDGSMSAQNVNNGQNVLLATEGVFVSASGLVTGDFATNFGDKLVTDADALAFYNQDYPTFIDLADGVTKKRAFRVS